MQNDLAIHTTKKEKKFFILEAKEAKVARSSRTLPRFVVVESKLDYIIHSLSSKSP
jgi:hypothetical protein